MPSTRPIRAPEGDVAVDGPVPLPVDIVPSETTDKALEQLGDVDRAGRVGRTALQVSLPAAIVGVGSWLARLRGYDLDPGAGVDLPADVAGYLVAIVATLIAVGMNRRPR